MSYHALARKWRPLKFSELVGQDHVVRALRHALSEDKLHHALLFTGTRGVGKTTLGRLVSKGLNCEQGVTAEPCGECLSCREIDEGRFVDLIEVDAASRTGVDDTRELLDNVQYAPARGRRKVYLIDEVHMLSKSAFNALLKTLEEPPSHVQFLLATTDPQKLPITVLSRCLQFNLKRLPQPEIQQQLDTVLGKENIEFEPAALSLLARAADGSMRDGLSLLDQAIAFGGGTVKAAEVAEMLGSIERGEVLEILSMLADRNVAILPALLARLDEQAPDYVLVLNELAASLQQIALLQAVPEVTLAADEESHREQYDALAKNMPAEDTQLFYQIAINGKRDLPLAPNPRIGFEMVLLRMLAFHSVLNGEGKSTQSPPRAADSRPLKPNPVIAQAPAKQNVADSQPPVNGGEAAQLRDEQNIKAAEQPEEQMSPEVIARPGAANISIDNLDIESWPGFVAGLEIQGMAAELVRQCAWGSLDDNKLTLKLAPSFENLNSDRYIQQVEEALEAKCGRPLKFLIEVVTHDLPTAAQSDAQAQAERMEEAEQALTDDPNVQALQERFGASIHPGSVEPLS